MKLWSVGFAAVPLAVTILFLAHSVKGTRRMPVEAAYDDKVTEPAGNKHLVL